MNLTKLNRRIVRETDVLVNGVPVIISLEQVRLLLQSSVQQQIAGGLMSLVSLMEVIL